MKKLTILFLMVLMLAVPSIRAAEADESSANAGNATMGIFLKLNWDPASYAMADAYSGFSDNFAGSIFINPAGVSRLTSSQFTLSSMLIPLTDVRLVFAGVAQSFGIEAAMAVGGAYIDWGEEEETDATGTTIGNFTNKNTMAFASFSSALGAGLYLGVTGKFIDQTLFDNYQKTFLADVGIQFIPEVFKKVGIGLSVTNIGIANSMAYNEAKLRAPTTFHLGWVIRLIDLYGSGLSFSFDNTFPVDGAYKLSLGGELNLGNTIILRSGYKMLGWDIPEFTFGLGLIVSNMLRIDMAYSDKGNLGKYELAALTVLFGRKEKKSEDWKEDVNALKQQVDALSQNVNTNTGMISDSGEKIDALTNELNDLKSILAQSSSELRKALEESQKKAQEDLAKKDAELAAKEAEQEAMKQKMAEEQKKAVEEAAKKAAEEATEKLRKEYEEKFNKIKEEVKEDKNIEVREDKRGIVLNLQGINFASGKAEVPPYVYPTLDRVARILGQYPDAKIRVEGHTDSVGNDVYNQSLSKARANAVMMYFIEKHAIPPQRIEAIGYGETMPIADNGTPDGRARNRRVEIIILGTTTTQTEIVKPVEKPAYNPGEFVVYVGSYDKEDDAIAEVKKIQGMGYSPSYVRVKLRDTAGNEKIIFRVKMGEYDEPSANRLIEELKAKGLDAWVKKQ